jgi:hypothetical protein
MDVEWSKEQMLNLIEKYELRKCLLTFMSKDYKNQTVSLTKCLTDFIFLKRSFDLDIECLSTLFTNTGQKRRSPTMFSQLYSQAFLTNIVRLGLYPALGSHLFQELFRGVVFMHLVTCINYQNEAKM